MWKVLAVLGLVVVLLFLLDVVLGRTTDETWSLGATGSSRRATLSVAEFFTGPVAIMMMLIGLPLSLTSYHGVVLLVTGTGMFCFRMGISHGRRVDRGQGDEETGTPHRKSKSLRAGPSE